MIARVVRESDGRTETEELDGNSLIWSNMVFAPHICAFAAGSVQFNSNATASVCD
jgi:hypothetical protein